MQPASMTGHREAVAAAVSTLALSTTHGLKVHVIPLPWRCQSTQRDGSCSRHSSRAPCHTATGAGAEDGGTSRGGGASGSPGKQKLPCPPSTAHGLKLHAIPRRCGNLSFPRARPTSPAAAPLAMISLSSKVSVVSLRPVISAFGRGFRGWSEAGRGCGRADILKRQLVVSEDAGGNCFGDGRDRRDKLLAPLRPLSCRSACPPVSTTDHRFWFSFPTLHRDLVNRITAVVVCRVVCFVS